MSDKSSASIDDLLKYEDEPPPRARRKASGADWWVRTALTAAALSAVTVFGLRVFGIGVSLVVVSAGFVALLILRRVTARVAPPPPPRTHGHRSAVDDGTYQWDDLDGLRSAVHRWERKLHWAQGEPDRFTRGVRPVIADLVDERLRQRHGFTRASDPGRARALLGEPLWHFLTSPATRSPTPRDCAAILAQMEKL